MVRQAGRRGISHQPIFCHTPSKGKFVLAKTKSQQLSTFFSSRLFRLMGVKVEFQECFLLMK
jgi:hypothetical protein